MDEGYCTFGDSEEECNRVVFEENFEVPYVIICDFSPGDGYWLTVINITHDWFYHIEGFEKLNECKSKLEELNKIYLENRL